MPPRVGPTVPEMRVVPSGDAMSGRDAKSKIPPSNKLRDSRGTAIESDLHFRGQRTASTDDSRQSYHGLEQLFSLEKKWPSFNLMALARTVDAQQAEAGM